MSFKFGIPEDDSEETSEPVFNGQTPGVILIENTSQSSEGTTPPRSTSGTSGLGSNTLGSVNSQNSGTNTAQSFGSQNQTFGNMSNQAFGKSQSQTFGSAQCSNFGAAQCPNFAPQLCPNFTAAQSHTFGAAQNNSFGAAHSQTFGAAQSQTFESTMGQTLGVVKGHVFGLPQNPNGMAYVTINPKSFGSPNQNMGATGPNNTQVFGGPPPTHAKGLFGAPMGSRSRSTGLYNNCVHPQPNFGSQNMGKFGAVNINVQEPINITGWNDQKGFLVNSPNTQCSNNRWFGNQSDIAGKLGSTNINVDQPITISAEDGVKFAVNQNNFQPGYFRQPVNNGTSGTNINVNQPINIKGYDEQTMRWFSTPKQPSWLVCAPPPCAGDAINKMSTTNITVNKPITITFDENKFHFGTHPASNFGSNPYNQTSLAELGKLGATNITVNKPITITGKNEPKFKFGIPPNVNNRAQF